MKTLKNKIQLIGTLTEDPKTEVLKNGKKKTTLSIETVDTITNHNGDKEEKEQRFKLSAWGGASDLAEKFLSKGSQIAIEGILIHRNEVDHENEIGRVFVEIEVHEFLMLGGRRSD